MTRESRAVGTIAALAIVAGTLQNPALTFVHVGLLGSVDDTLVLLLVVAVLPRVPHVRGGPVLGIALWLAAGLVALTFSPTRFGIAVLLFRQILMPVLLVLVGLCLRPREWRAVRTAAIAVALANGAYIALETVGVRLIDPTVVAASNGVWAAGGLPGYYYGYDPFGHLLIRAGGLVLNPPTAGIVTVAGAIFLLQGARGSVLRTVVGVGLLGATLATGSRAAILIGVAALVVPWLARRLGAAPTIVLAGAAMVLSASALSSQGGSDSHTNGLVGGLVDAFTTIFGKGFGYAGDYADPMLATSAESLTGIAFSAEGVVAVAAVAVLLAVCLRRALVEHAWLPALAAGAVVAACFAETAGAIAGTVPVWIAVGVALQGTGAVRAGTPAVTDRRGARSAAIQAPWHR